MHFEKISSTLKRTSVIIAWICKDNFMPYKPNYIFSVHNFFGGFSSLRKKNSLVFQVVCNEFIASHIHHLKIIIIYHYVGIVKEICNNMQLRVSQGLESELSESPPQL